MIEKLLVDTVCVCMSIHFFHFSFEDNEPPTVPANDGHLKFNLPN